METNDRAGVLGALLAQGRGLPRLGSGADYLAYDVERVCFAAYDGMGGWQMEEAERLDHAERCRLAEALVSRRRKGLTLEDAYRVQWCGAALRVREGACVLGHKVGLTSKAMQHQVGIDTPDSGFEGGGHGRCRFVVGHPEHAEPAGQLQRHTFGGGGHAGAPPLADLGEWIVGLVQARETAARTRALLVSSVPTARSSG